MNPNAIMNANPNAILNSNPNSMLNSNPNALVNANPNALVNGNLNGALNVNPNALNAQNAMETANQVSNGEVPSATALLNGSPNSMQANAANLNFTNPGQLNKGVLKSNEDCCCSVM